MIRVMACAPKPVPPPPPPPKKRIPIRPQMKKAIDQAMLLCANFEDTIECKLAWEKVEELSAALNDQKKLLEEEAERFSAAEERMYDL